LYEFITNETISLAKSLPESSSLSNSSRVILIALSVTSILHSILIDAVIVFLTESRVRVRPLARHHKRRIVAFAQPLEDGLDLFARLRAGLEIDDALLDRRVC
jgi:Flp pilus assembly protein TadB